MYDKKSDYALNKLESDAIKDELYVVVKGRDRWSRPFRVSSGNFREPENRTFGSPFSNHIRIIFVFIFIPSYTLDYWV